MDFLEKRALLAERNWVDSACQKAAREWHDASRTFDYQYMFEWMGRPIIQDPQDVCAIQEIIWRYQPDAIVETGVARGGSLVLSASILASMAYGEILKGDTPIARKVIGVDIDIREHNRLAIETHALAPMITLIEGSSVDPKVFDQVKQALGTAERILVFLDSNHTRDHVYEELQIYAPLVSHGGSILVMDTGIEYAPIDSFNVSRPWGPGNSPLTAVDDFLATEGGSGFAKDLSIEKRHLLTCAPQGLLNRI